MTRFVYLTATTLNGYLADEQDSLAWLFAVDATGTEQPQAEFMEGVGVLVQGSTTYEWVLREAKLLENVADWSQHYGERPSYVFTSRALEAPEGADVRFRSGDIAPVIEELREAAAGKDVWIVGGGDLAGQFFDAGALDRIELSFAPATVAAGRPLLPRTVDPSRLRLVSVEQRGQFAHLVYDIVR
jgi:dihydrofolate reductase